VRKLLRMLFLGCLPCLPALAASPPGLLVLPRLESLEPQAKDSVSISLDASLLATAARFLDDGSPEDRDLKDLVSNLQGVYVRSYTFDHSFTYPTTALDSMRNQLRSACWQSIVSVRKSSAGSAVDIFICQVQQQARGLAIIATEPRQLTIVNIVGAIDLDKLHRLEGHFGIPRLPQDK
jgi:hypothetical protein